jgi:pimeloyl-ACP methyl ester carboxylesterase
MKRLASSLAAILAIGSAGTSWGQQAQREEQRPTIVLVHGAFAESSSWNPVISRLVSRGYPVVAAANPLRGIRSDAADLSAIVRSIPGPVVLVGHSYGGSVISTAAHGAPNVKALVYVAGYAPEVGESASDLAARFPGGTLGEALAPPVQLASGGADLYILPARFWRQFAADVPESEAVVMAVTQRPVLESALSEDATAAAWKTIPSWFIYGSLDRNIPRTAHNFMARRAAARESVEVDGASHVVMQSHPAAVAGLIERAAAGRR